MHYIGDKALIKTTKVNAKIVLKNDQTHIFADKPIDLNSEWHICESCSLCDSKNKSQVSKKYVIYPPLILLPTGTKISKQDAQNLLLEHKNCTHVAINAPIKENDVVRRPQIEPVIGDFGPYFPEFSLENAANSFWASSIQNQITQVWAPMYTMFSRGNITEKKRVLTDFNAQNQIQGTHVIDLYAGIGYFTFSYAKQRPKTVYCWELNPWSVHGMVKAAAINNFNIRVVHETEHFEPQETDQIVVFLETNLMAPKRLKSLSLDISHINMGLLPHAWDSFDTALELASFTDLNTVFHIHENVRLPELEDWEQKTSLKFGKCLHVEKIKMYSPGVAHVCGDFQIQN